MVTGESRQSIGWTIGYFKSDNTYVLLLCHEIQYIISTEGNETQFQFCRYVNKQYCHIKDSEKAYVVLENPIHPL